MVDPEERRAVASENESQEAQVEESPAVSEKTESSHDAKKKPDTPKKKTKKKKKGKKRKISIKSIVAIAAVVVIVAAVLPGFLNCSREGVTVSETSLKKAVSISKLSSAEFTYEGITQKTDDRENALYHIYYEATISAGIDMEQIAFQIDKENKTITPVLPDFAISSPVVDESVIEFLPRDANVDMREVIELCKKDAVAEIEKLPSFKQTALRNMRATIEALLMPLIEPEGYSIVWDDEGSSSASSGSSASQDSSSAEGGNNESGQ